ncbi:HER175Wp [Eremothecium sinecaudum]|uniref:HER175Wp n=1 Tax=Eremothecium sinecaudum TaxID=45286 RepID=A0A0X8HU21_9SACH|nr:HER175Wp [Eremothecium sinecaudum]AMD21454.1 HER175Wp [Eremothecium sinecaudum]
MKMTEVQLNRTVSMSDDRNCDLSRPQLVSQGTSDAVHAARCYPHCGVAQCVHVREPRDCDEVFAVDNDIRARPVRFLQTRELSSYPGEYKLSHDDNGLASGELQFCTNRRASNASVEGYDYSMPLSAGTVQSVESSAYLSSPCTKHHHRRNSIAVRFTTCSTPRNM